MYNVESAKKLSLSALLKKYKLRPRKGLGQNFLSDPLHLGKIIEAADLTSKDTVLEVGPGPGMLTRLLTETAGRVVAVELDPHMVHLLQTEYGHLTNLTVVQADILQARLDRLIPHPGDDPQPTSDANPPAYKVVANLPYYITSAVLRYLLEATPKPERVVVTIQKEVAQRITAKPNKMSLLAVSVQLYGQPTLVHHIPASAFYPPPKVDSAVVRIDLFPHPALTDISPADFFRVVKAGFAQKRKQLKNTLAGGLRRPSAEIVAALEQAGIAPTRRAETLTLAEWNRLAGILND